MTSSRESSLCMTPKTTTPLSGQIPKYGTLIPNRVFVGGISAGTSENELKQFFSSYGVVKECKIIFDRSGISKSYGFITFEKQEDAERILKIEAENLIFKDRKLNVGPAIRKQQAFQKMFFEQPNFSHVNVNGSTLVYQNGLAYSVLNGMVVVCHSDGYMMPAQQQPSSPAAAAAVYPVMVSPQSYISRPPSYFQSPPASTSPAQWNIPGSWRWASQNSGNQLTATNPIMYHPIYPMVSQDASTIYPSSPMYGCKSSTDLADVGVAAQYGYGSNHQSTTLS